MRGLPTSAAVSRASSDCSWPMTARGSLAPRAIQSIAQQSTIFIVLILSLSVAMHAEPKHTACHGEAFDMPAAYSPKAPALPMVEIEPEEIRLGPTTPEAVGRARGPGGDRDGRRPCCDDRLGRPMRRPRSETSRRETLPPNNPARAPVPADTRRSARLRQGP